MRQAHPIAETAGLGHAAADIGERQSADECAVRVAKDQECVALVGTDVLTVAPDAAPERASGQIVGRPGRLPRGEKIATGLSQRRPFDKVRHLRHAQRDTITADRRRRLGKVDGTEERHSRLDELLWKYVWRSRGPAGQTLGDCRRAFKPGAESEHSGCHLAAADQGPAGGAGAFDSHGIDFFNEFLAGTGRPRVIIWRASCSMRAPELSSDMS